MRGGTQTGRRRLALHLAVRLAAVALLAGSGPPVAARTAPRVNILLITVDDMNWNSVGAFGAAIPDITPNIDALARQGRRFDRAYVAASNCAPSRVALFTGLYPQQTGATGFFYVDDAGLPTIAGLLRNNAYLTAVINKPADGNPAPDGRRYWDVQTTLGAARKYDPGAFAQASASLFGRARAERKPFYLVVNIADPHKPNFNDEGAAASGADRHRPSRIIAEQEVQVPGFLPDLPGIRRDVRNYLNSVKRADDSVGAIMAALRASGAARNTLVIFLSDHGMPFPFAKSSVYDNSLRTPLIMAWPGRIPAGTVETRITASVDLMPSILAAAGVAPPAGPRYFGQSLLNPGAMADRAYAYGSFDENARGYPVPMRGVIGREWAYVFNAWSDGEHQIRNDDMNHASFKQMQLHAPADPAIKARLDHYLAPPIEELCHLKTDPDCLINRAADPANAAILDELRRAARAQMVRTNDHLLEAFDRRSDPPALRAVMRRLHAAAAVRARTLQWKRPDNIAGVTRANAGLFDGAGQPRPPGRTPEPPEDP